MTPTFPTLSANDIKSAETSPQTLDAISTAFSSTSSPGILLVSNHPLSFISWRRSLYSSARTLANLPPHELTSTLTASSPFRGWSRGVENFNGVPDVSKGSFYANPLYDRPVPPDAFHKSYASSMPRNVWPSQSSLSLFEPSFKNLGQYLNELCIHLSRHLDEYVRYKLPDCNASSLHKSLSSSCNPVGRVLNYFPPSPPTWCGVHNDHGSLTALLSGAFYQSDSAESLPPDPEAGLHILCNGVEHRVMFPADVIAFQIGEAAQIMSGGVLRATPHFVKGGVRKDVSRVSFAVFFQPNPWDPLIMPKGAIAEDVLQTDKGIPQLASRWVEGDTFGMFSERTGRAYAV